MSQISNMVPNSASDSTLVFSDLLRSYESSQLIYCGLSRANQTSGGKTLLFDSALVAKEAAYILLGNWDGVNAVTIRRYDSIAVQAAVELVKLELGQEEQIDFCQQGQYCFFNQLSMDPKTKARSGKSIILGEKLMKALEGEWERVPIESLTQAAD